MIDYGYKELNTNPAWRYLLSAYQEAQDSSREQSSREEKEFDGWTPRINTVVGIDEAELCRVHGKLISLGYLKFELGNRLDGIKYQLSTDAVRALDATEANDDSEFEGEAEDHRPAA